MSNSRNRTTRTTTPGGEGLERTRTFTYDQDGNIVYVPDVRREVSYESVSVPNEETQKLFQEQIVPNLIKKHGVEFDENGNASTPLSRFATKTAEKERQRREREKRLNEFKRKEANWYNGISLLMDIAGAAAGSNVQERTPSDAAAAAIARNEELRQEQKQEDSALEELKQKSVGAFYQELNDRIKDYSGKVTTKEVTKPFEEKYTIIPDRNTVTTTTVLGGASSTNGSSGVSNSSVSNSSTSSGRGKQYSIVVNTSNNGVERRETVSLSQNDYSNIGNILASYYEDLISHPSVDPGRKPRKRASQEEKDEYNRKVEEQRQQIAFKNELKNLLRTFYNYDNSKYTWNVDWLLSNGVLYNLPQDIKDFITEKSGGQITFGRPVQIGNGVMKETVIIKKDGSNASAASTPTTSGGYNPNVNSNNNEQPL